ncbi:MAG: response regulator [Actinomycetota bacterium]|nr:response regulator [Actinomycetota bacterium]
MHGADELGTAGRLAPVANEGLSSVLVVDDEEPIRKILMRLLDRNGYDCMTAADADEARKLLRDKPFAIVLTDMNMPGVSGLDLIMQITAEYPDIATVMITGLDDAKLANAALEMGAYGYIIKPFEPNEVLINVANALRRRSLEIENRNHRVRLEQMVKDRTSELWNAIAQLENAEKELRLSREETIQKLSIAAEFRDDETGQHIERMSRYCGLLAGTMDEDSERVEVLRLASQMHDVGKIGIPDQILLKPGPLTPDERVVIEKHCDIGYRILVGSKSNLLNVASTLALSHHEKFDGSGYPRGLAGEEIPIEGRIGAIADVFDALTSDRVYKRAMPLGKALDVLREGRGTHFDPDLLDLFLSSFDSVVAIKAQYADR